MWLGHYLGPPTQSLGSLYKLAPASEDRRSSTVARQFTANRTMRKTRLVILPGVRSITQIGCLLLFLACPTIAFKGQEKRDVEPICKVHELKYWWLPFDTGEGESSFGQTWTRYDCQRDDMGIKKGKDNATDSIPHTCDESMISHGHAAIYGQEASYNFKTNFGREAKWLIYSPTGSSTTDISSRRTSVSQSRKTRRSEMLRTLHKTEKISSVSLERRVSCNNDQLIGTDSQSSSTRGMVRNRLQRDTREGSVTRGVNERRKSLPISLQKDSFTKTRLSSRIIPESSFRYQNIERNAALKQNDDSQRGSSEQKGLYKTLEGQENNKISTLSFGTKYNSGKHLLNSYTRLNTYIQVKREVRDREERLSNDARLVSERREVILERTSSQQDILKRTKRSDRRSRNLGTSESSRLDRRISEHKSPQQRRQRSSAFFEQRENEQRYRYLNGGNEQSRMNRRLERAESIDIEQHIADSRSVRHESRVFSLNRRTTEPNIRRESSRDNDSKEDRETSHKSMFAEIKPQNLEERPRMDKRIKRATTFDKGLRLSERRLGRSIESQVFSSDRRITEMNSLGRRQSSLACLERREMIQRSKVAMNQPNALEKQSNMDRRIECAMTYGERQRLPDKRSRSVDYREFNLEKRTPEWNLQGNISINKKEPPHLIRSEILRESRTRENVLPLYQNTLRRNGLSLYKERQEKIHLSRFAITQPKDTKEQSITDRKFQRTVSIDNELRSSNRRSARSTDSRVFVFDRRMEESYLRKEIKKQEKESSRRISKDITKDSRYRIYENVFPAQNIIQRQSTPSGVERREINKRSTLEIIQTKEDRSRIDRRLERAASIDREKLSLDRRRLEHFSLSRLASSDRSMNNLYLRRDDGKQESLANRRIRSEILRDMRNEIPENILMQNTLRRQRSSTLLERREMTRLSRFGINQPKDFVEYSNTRRFESDTSTDSRHGNRENVFSQQNILQRQRTTPARVERREITRRSAISIIQPKDSEGRFPIERRVKRAASIDREKRSSDGRTERSVEYRVFSFDRRMDSNLRRDVRKHEKETNREVRLVILRESRIGIRRQSSWERRETTRGSLQFAITSPEDFESRSKTDRRQEFSSDKGRSQHSVEFRGFSLNQRMAECFHRRVNGKQEEVSTRRIISEIFGDTRHGNQENIPQRRNTVGRHNSPSKQEHREKTKQSRLVTTQANDSDGSSRTNRRLQSAASIDREQHLYSRRRSERSIDSRVVVLDRSMDRSILRRDVRIYEKESNPEITLLRESRIRVRRESSWERKETIRRPLRFAINLPEDFQDRSKIDRRLERAVSIGKEQRTSDRGRSQHSVEFRGFSLNRRMAELNNERRSERTVESRVLSSDRSMTDLYLRRDGGKRENFGTRRIRSEIFKDTQYVNRENIPQQRTVGRHNSPSNLEQSSFDRRRTERSADSRVFVFDRSEILRESRIGIRRQSSWVRKETIRRSLKYVINPPYLDKVQKERKYEKYMENENHFNRRTERISEFIRLRRNIQEIRDSSNNQKEDIISQPEIIATVQRRVTYDSLRTSKMQETDGNKKHISLEDRQMRDEEMTPIFKMRRDINHIKQSIRSSMHRTTPPATFASYPDRQNSHTGQKTHSSQKPPSSQKTVITATISRASGSELHHGNVLLKSQIQDESQLLNAHKSTQLSPSWIGKVISAIKMAVTGSTPEENIFNLPKDSGLARYKYLSGHEHQIIKMRPVSDKSNDKGHLLQDFVLGSVVAGYFISSIHLKIRDYRNFICIF